LEYSHEGKIRRLCEELQMIYSPKYFIVLNLFIDDFDEELEEEA